jgi:pyrimidine operon attenuation protein/uracil phosphoribosyltransferase
VDARRYRDDKQKPEDDQTEVPFQITGKTVILVDEVVFTARTARAALDAVMDLGRPDRVQLAVLVDRGHRELPIEPNYTGKTVFTDRTDRVTVKVNEVLIAAVRTTLGKIATRVSPESVIVPPKVIR